MKEIIQPTNLAIEWGNYRFEPFLGSSLTKMVACICSSRRLVSCSHFPLLWSISPNPWSRGVVCPHLTFYNTSQLGGCLNLTMSFVFFTSYLSFRPRYIWCAVLCNSMIANAFPLQDIIKKCFPSSFCLNSSSSSSVNSSFPYQVGNTMSSKSAFLNPFFCDSKNLGLGSIPFCGVHPKEWNHLGFFA